MADRFNDRQRRWRRWDDEEDRFERQGGYNRRRGFEDRPGWGYDEEIVNPYDYGFGYGRGSSSRGADYNREYFDRGPMRGQEYPGFYDRERRQGYNREFDRGFDRGRRQDFEERGYGPGQGWAGSREFEGRDYTRGPQNRRFYDRDFERGRQYGDYYGRGFDREREQTDWYGRGFERDFNRDFGRSRQRGFASRGRDWRMNQGYPSGYYDRDFDRDFYDRDYEYNAPGFYDRDLDRGYTSGFYDQDFEEPGWLYTETWFISGPFEGLGPRGYEPSDDRICEQVCERLTQHGQLDASDIEVEVDNGEVILRGSVDSRRSKWIAEEAVESIPGIRDIHNQLRVSNAGLMRGAGREDVIMPGRIKEGMRVVDRNGERIGKVKEVRNGDFLLKRTEGRSLFVPFSALDRTNGEITLNIQADEIDRQNWHSPEAKRSGEAPGE